MRKAKTVLRLLLFALAAGLLLGCGDELAQASNDTLFIARAVPTINAAIAIT